MSKGPDAFRTISEVADELDLPQHVLRFWETRFTQIRPMKRGGGRRYYRPDDVELLRGIRHLLYGEGYTIKGVQRILKEQGARHVIAAGHGMALSPAPDDVSEDDGADEPAPVAKPRPETDDNGGSRPFYSRATPTLPERREPVFSPAPPGAKPPGDAPVVRAPSTDEPRSSRIPPAPDEPVSSAEAFLPPLVTAAPAPPAPQPGRAQPSDDYAPPAIERRQEPISTARSEPERVTSQADDRRIEREQGEPDRAREQADFGDRRSRAAAIDGNALTRDELRQLQATLFELLECKRILDQAR